MDGILNVIKPVGISSFSFMRKVQRKLGIKKIGHLGTLDPNACGVLVLLCGKATKLNQTLSGGTKVYRSVFTFGIETDTLDSAGAVISHTPSAASGCQRCRVSASAKLVNRPFILKGNPTRKQIEMLLPSLTGEIEIEIPKFSAVHINGKRAYDLARRGIDFSPPKKVVKIHRFELLAQLAPEKFFVEIECETGTYVRSLAKLVAKRLGTVAIASSILRTRVGDFDIKHAKSLHNVEISDIMHA